MAKNLRTGWAICGEVGLYVGWWLTRAAAIKEHCRLTGRDWKYCRRRGDRAVKIEIRYS